MVIKDAKKGQPGFRAENPIKKEDVFVIMEVDKSKLKPGTEIIEIKQGCYLKRDHKEWPRIALKGNPTLD